MPRLDHFQDISWAGTLSPAAGARVSNDLIPTTDNAEDLGTAALRWRNIRGANFNGRFAGGGTALTAGDFALSAGWGSTATVTAVTGTDQSFDFTVTPNGAGIADSPTITATFKDGAWPSPPILVIMQRGGTGAPARIDYTPSATAPIITWGDVPVAGSTYIFSVVCMGRE